MNNNLQKFLKVGITTTTKYSTNDLALLNTEMSVVQHFVIKY